MKDVEITKTFGVPASTLAAWKKSKNWRRDLYRFLKRFDREEAERFMVAPRARKSR